jgi:thymidylate synthase
MNLIKTSHLHKYDPLYKPNQLICGQGQIAIVTGWTVKNHVAKHLNPKQFAVIGNLYSPTRGISPLIRNLLVNPHVHFLVILNATKEDQNAGGCQCLLDFFNHGFKKEKSDTGKDCWAINSDITGFIDIEIDEKALNVLKQSLTVKEANSVTEALTIVNAFSEIKKEKNWGEPSIFPVNEVTPNVFPGNRYGHRIEGKTIAETWVKILQRIKTTGTIRPTGYDGQWQELIDLMAIVTDEPENFYFPEPNYLPVDREFLNNYIPQILEDAPYQEGVKYTYGQRLRSWFKKDQIEQVIHKLITEIDAASAVMNLWDVNDHEKGGSPCLNHIWLRVVNDELSLTATIRSNDMFAAWVANAMGLRALQIHIRDEIAKRSDYKLKLAPLITISQSAHIYDDTWENVDKLITTQYAKICKRQDYFDSCGNFLISIENQEIIVQQTTPGSGEIVAIYSGKTAKSLSSKIAQQVPHVNASHALYLGTELQKAEIALKFNFEYTQDQPLKND